MTLDGPEEFRPTESRLEHDDVLSAQRKHIKQAFEIAGLRAGSPPFAPPRGSPGSAALI